ncbi:MAG TPA: MarR family transcriptional regulator [Sphingomonadaceae bacterium]
MAGEPIDLQGYFPFFLGTISNRWTTTSSRIYLEKFGIGIGEWRVLASIHSFGTASSQEVVGLISMDASAVSRSMAKLEKQGLVEAVKGKFAGRTKPYQLTEKGRELYAEVQRVALGREDALLGGLSGDERRTLIELMRKVMNRLEDI